MIVVVRHGQTEANYENIMQGRSNNLLLNDTGRRQCDKLKKELDNYKFDICYSSPLIRCVETGMILIGDKCELVTDSRIIERELGNFEGKNRELYNHNKYWDYKLNSLDDGVEGVISLTDRCREFLNYIDNEKNILIVTHAACFRAINNILDNFNSSDIEIDNCFYKVFE